jgi:uncharacterized membrane protein
MTAATSGLTLGENSRDAVLPVDVSSISDAWVGGSPKQTKEAMNIQMIMANLACTVAMIMNSGVDQLVAEDCWRVTALFRVTTHIKTEEIGCVVIYLQRVVALHV